MTMNALLNVIKATDVITVIECDFTGYDDKFTEIYRCPADFIRTDMSNYHKEHYIVNTIETVNNELVIYIAYEK